MTQDEYNTARGLISDGLNVVIDGLVEQEMDIADPQALLTLTGMLTQVVKASMALREGNPAEVGHHLDWLNENAPDIELVCTCPDCTKERAEAAN